MNKFLHLGIIFKLIKSIPAEIFNEIKKISSNFEVVTSITIKNGKPSYNIVVRAKEK